MESESQLHLSISSLCETVSILVDSTKILLWEILYSRNLTVAVQKVAFGFITTSWLVSQNLKQHHQSSLHATPKH